MNGKHLDLTSEPAKPASPPNAATEAPRFLGVKFECCSVYARVYRNQAGDAYEGRCPKCLRLIRFEIGPGGTSDRFFTAS